MIKVKSTNQHLSPNKQFSHGRQDTGYFLKFIVLQNLVALLNINYCLRSSDTLYMQELVNAMASTITCYFVWNSDAKDYYFSSALLRSFDSCYSFLDSVCFFVQRFSNLDQSMLPLFEYGGYSDAPNPIKINQRIAKFF